MDIEQNMVMTVRGGFFVIVFIRYALKKVIKILSISIGLFLSALVYLQYHQQIAEINLDKLQFVSPGAISNLANATAQIPNNVAKHDNHTSTIAITNSGIPLTGSIATGFAVGFMKG